MPDEKPVHVTPADRIHFPGLNALRFYAALAVVYSHVVQNVSPLPVIAEIMGPFLIDGHSAVNLFFVLSGFLITYLLLRESMEHGDVAVGKFYVRRILRIWPLYYLVIIIGLLVFPLIFGQDYTLSVFYAEYPYMPVPITTKLALVFFLLPNLAGITAPMVHIWSIGVEEQFYLVWPWIVRDRTRILKACLAIFVLKFTLAAIIPLLNVHGAMSIFEELRFECMAVGALGAYAYCEASRWLKWCYHPVAQFLAWGVFVYLTWKTNVLNPSNSYGATIMAISFVIIILNMATNPRSLVRLDHPFLERMGQISYGLYMYHFPFLYLVLRLARHFNLNDAFFYPTTFFIVSLVGTWLVAELSYRWFETPFLNLKDRFTVLRT
jgi:peptidoglycan/LPS O-acetylase OafA/YrhL